MNRPATARTMTNPMRVMPRCFCFTRLLPYVRKLPLSADARTDALEFHATVNAHPDQECLAPQLPLGQHAPVSAVVAMVAIVAHHEIVTRRHFPVASPRVHERRTVGFQDGVGTSGKIL